MRLAIISGALANKPFNGGNAWSRLGWVLGFQKLGFEVLFIEQIRSRSCIYATGEPSPFRTSANLAYFQQTMAEFGLSNNSVLICDEGSEVHGMGLDQLTDLAKNADVLFNISGHLTLPSIMARVPKRVYYDDDPGYTQFWHAQGISGARLSDHEFHFTLGANVGKPTCPIPTSGIHWQVTRPPVVLEQWDAKPHPKLDRFTTVASWRGAYAPIQFNGSTYGLKAHEFRKMIELPQRSPYTYEIALQIHPGDGKDIETLRAHGWQLSDPFDASSSPSRFRQFIQRSGAEFSVAQGIYVDTHSGWFSDRTARYLASGRPALVQNTGFADEYSCGEGLLAFANLDEAVAGAERIAQDYPGHCLAARHLAEDYFDSDKVIGEVAKKVGLKIR